MIMLEKDFSLPSISEIKAYLDSQGDLSTADLNALRRDKRKGVQKLLEAYLRERERNFAEIKRLQKMTARETALRQRGYTLVAGVDEAGRGPLAGPVVAAAVILSPEKIYLWKEIDDSKKLSAEKREKLFKIITANADGFAVGAVNAPLIDRINIYRASLEAMRLAVQQLWPQPHYLFVDGFIIPGVSIPQEAVKHGDALCLSIAAASIVAKVIRDRIMESYDRDYPGYGFAQNKGYPTPEHKTAIKALGVSPIHRKSFKV